MIEKLEQLLDTYGLSKFLPALLTLIVGWIALRIILAVEKAALRRPEPKVDASQEKFLTKGTKIICWAVIPLEVCKLLGFSTGSLLTVFAASGAAIALALQGSLSNIAGGILMLFTKPFARGDYISCGGSEGFVESVDLLSTTIVTADNRVISIPNSAITGSTLVNASAKETRRVEVSIGISYDSDIGTARKAVTDLAASTGYFLESPAPSCDAASYGDTAVKLVFYGWVKSADVIPATNAMNNGLKPALEAAGVGVPCPRVEVRRIEG